MATDFTKTSAGSDQAFVEGVDSIVKALRTMGELPSADEMSDVLRLEAKDLQNDIKSRAPRGPTGNLRKGVIVKKLERKRGRSAYLVAMDYKIAPHYFMVEYGTTGQRAVKSKQALYSSNTNEFFGTSVAPMPPRPFFRPAVDAFKHGDRVKSFFAKRLDSIWRKK